jgi:hypothetical protein
VPSYSSQRLPPTSAEDREFINQRLFGDTTNPKLDANGLILKEILAELKSIKYEMVLNRWRDQATDFERFWDTMNKIKL